MSLNAVLCAARCDQRLTTTTCCMEACSTASWKCCSVASITKLTPPAIPVCCPDAVEASEDRSTPRDKLISLFCQRHWNARLVASKRLPGPTAKSSTVVYALDQDWGRAAPNAARLAGSPGRAYRDWE